MANNIDNKKMSAFSVLIRDLAANAAENVDSIQLPKRGKDKVRNYGDCASVYFLPNEKVVVDLYVNIRFGALVPETVCKVQESVIKAVEQSTRYKVHAVNVHVISVINSEDER